MSTIAESSIFLFLSLILLLESVIRHLLTLFYKVFPCPALLDGLHKQTRLLRVAFNKGFAGPESKSLFNLSLRELAEYYGYNVEEHSVETPDGFYLVVHRLLPKKTVSVVDADLASCWPPDAAPLLDASSLNNTLNDYTRLSSRAEQPAPHLATCSPTSQYRDLSPCQANRTDTHSPADTRPPILLMHGLMMNAEVFLIDDRISTAVYFLNAGYDVWLGNSRGNKYSWLHRKYKRNDDRYWDFSIDELARFDVPALTQHILRVTGFKSLGYLGFSNGSTQMLAALASNPSLNSLISFFIALAPACKLRTLNPRAENFGLLYPILMSNHRIFLRIFGRKAMLQLTVTWRNILSARIPSPCPYGSVISLESILPTQWTV